ncbi:MAG: hypothetical protein ABIM74_10340 [candidate division WOR-3 bacterium]
MVFVVLFSAIRSETATISDLSILEDTVVSNLLMDERVKVFSGQEVILGLRSHILSPPRNRF